MKPKYVAAAVLVIVAAPLLLSLLVEDSARQPADVSVIAIPVDDRAVLDRLERDGNVQGLVVHAQRVDPATRDVAVEAVVRLGRLKGDSATAALRGLAEKSHADKTEVDRVRLAALSALWARGDREFVTRLATDSDDPAVRSKVRALRDTE